MIRHARLAALALILALTAQDAGAAIITYATVLSGPAESPPNNSPGTGFALVEIDTIAHTMRVQANFSGLTGTTTASHIHAATALPGVGTVGVATQLPTFANFPLGVTSGTFSQTLDTLAASTYNPAYVTSNGGTTATAESALFAALNAGTSYFNIHTSLFSGGEIRGFLTVVPEPASIASLGVGLLVASAVALGRRGRHARI